MSSLRQIQNRQATKAESDPGGGVRPRSLVIWAAVDDRCDHSLECGVELLARQRPGSDEDSGQSTHYDAAAFNMPEQLQWRILSDGAISVTLFSMAMAAAKPEQTS